MKFKVGDLVKHKTTVEVWSQSVILIVVDTSDKLSSVSVRWMAVDGKFYTQELYEFEIEKVK